MRTETSLDLGVRVARHRVVGREGHSTSCPFLLEWIICEWMVPKCKIGGGSSVEKKDPSEDHYSTWSIAAQVKNRHFR